MWALPWRTKASSELGIQRGIHPAFNGHSMGEIWHSGFFGSAEPYFSWNGPDQFSGGNFLIIILVGAKDQSLSRMGCTQVPGSRPLLEFYGELVACPWQQATSRILWGAGCLHPSCPRPASGAGLF